MRVYSSIEQAQIDLPLAQSVMSSVCKYVIERIEHVFTCGGGYAIACYSPQGNFNGYY